jgi:hypothetical protein
MVARPMQLLSLLAVAGSVAAGSISSSQVSSAQAAAKNVAIEACVSVILQLWYLNCSYGVALCSSLVYSASADTNHNCARPPR